MSLHRVAIPSPNYSSRGSSRVRLVVLHTAEGARTIESLGSFFQNPSAGVSSHTGADDKAGTVGEYVPPGLKAWTAAEFNPIAVQIELCGFAAWSRDEWRAHPAMLDNCSQWIAEECARFGLPIRRLSAAEAQGGGAGVCEHADLGSAGGGHWDCGSGVSAGGGFPIDDVIAAAAGGTSSPAPPAPIPRKGRNMIASTDTGGGYWCVTPDGAVYAFGDALYAGGAFDFDESEPGRQAMAPGTSIVGIAGKGRDGYWLFADDGGVFCFGSAGFWGRPDRFD